MTTTDTAAPPRKRAPRKAAAAATTPAADEPKPGVTSRTAESVREQLEAATGEQVTAGAVRRLRGGVTAYQVTPGKAERLAHAGVAHPDDPGPVAPGVEEDPDAVAGRDDDYTPAAIDRDQAVDLLRPPSDEAIAAAQAEVDQAEGIPSPATPPAGLPADLTAEDREAIAGDVATIVAFTAGLAAAAAAEDTADRALALDVDDFDHGDEAPAEHTAETFAADLERLAATRAAADQARQRAAAALDVDEAEVDLRTLVAIDLAGVDAFDLSTLVAGHVATAPDGRRVTVLDPPARPAADVFDAAAHAAMRQAYDAAHVDTATGEILLEGGDPTRVKLSAQLAAAIEEARALEARAGELKEAAEEIRAQVREALGGEAGRGEVAVAPDGTELARWTRVTSTKCSTTALKKADPDTWAKYATTTVSRRFTWAD